MSDAQCPSKNLTLQAITNASAQGQPADRLCLASPVGYLAQPPLSSASGQPQRSSSDTPQQEVVHAQLSNIASPVPSCAPATASSTPRVGNISQPFRGQGFGYPFPRAPRTPGEYIPSSSPTRKLIPECCADIAYYQTPPEFQYPGAIPIPPSKPSDDFRGNGAYESPYDPRVGVPSYHAPSSPYWTREGNASGTSDTQGNGQ
jgi:hypothetical protein